MGVHVVPTRDSAGNIVTHVAPFASKGKNHFRGTGVKNNITTNDVGNIDYTVPLDANNAVQTFRYNAIEVLNGDYGDNVQLQIVDTPQGTYSGYPNAVLDQFGINWNMRKELIKVLPYEATLYSGMLIRVVYSNSTGADKEIYVNHDLHLVV
jgi:hypothetical protein